MKVGIVGLGLSLHFVLLRHEGSLLCKESVVGFGKRLLGCVVSITCVRAVVADKHA